MCIIQSINMISIFVEVGFVSVVQRWINLTEQKVFAEINKFKDEPWVYVIRNG
jgi:hypothetical protein